MYVCIYVCMCVCVCLHVCVYACTCVRCGCEAGCVVVMLVVDTYMPASLKLASLQRSTTNALSYCHACVRTQQLQCSANGPLTEPARQLVAAERRAGRAPTLARIMAATTAYGDSCGGEQPRPALALRPNRATRKPVQARNR